MNCKDVQDSLAGYWDMPDASLEKREIEAHLQHCEVCKSEYKLWEESIHLVQSMDLPNNEVQETNNPVSRQVMDRIYAKEGWLRPVSEHIYEISYRLRRNLLVMISVFITLFLFGLIYPLFHTYTSASHTLKPEVHSIEGVQPLTAASENVSSAASTVPNGVASLSDLPMLKMGPIHTVPDYLIALSFLGLTSTMLIMNWLIRTRS